MSAINILHISDLHLSPPNVQLTALQREENTLGHRFCKKHSPGARDALIRFVSQRADQLDAIVITGDIATSGRRSDLSLALSVVEEMRNFVEPVVILPGNHDRYVGSKRPPFLLPGSKNFDSIFANHWNADGSVTVLEQGDLVVCLISYDFTLRMPRDASYLIGILAQGRVTTDSINFLRKHSEACTSSDAKSLALLWTLHFPPWAPEIDVSSILLDGGDLLGEAKIQGVDAILSGHLHYDFDDTPDRVRLMGVGTVCQDQSDNHLRILTITDESGRPEIKEPMDFDFDREVPEFVERPSKLR